jgi:hypothetical protein
MTSFDIIAGIASILGLVASMGAWLQARSASTAAKEARDGILLRTLADEFELACIKIDQLLDLVLHDRLPEAGIRAQELTSVLSEIPYRRSPYLSEKRMGELIVAREQVRLINQSIVAMGHKPPTAGQKQETLQECQKISMTLRQNLGTIRGEMDRGANK